MTGHSLNVLKLSTVSSSLLAIEVSTKVIYHILQDIHILQDN